MANYNKVILAGNMTRDPQLSFLPSNTPVVDFGLATNRRWRGQDGQLKEDTCFIDCKVYGKAAETVNQYMSKGRSILIEGRLQFQQWTAKDGGKRSKHVVVVDTFQFLDGGRRDGGSSRENERNAPSAQNEDHDSRDAAPQAAGEDDVPF